MYEHIIVGTDGSATATKAVEAASAIAGDCGGRLHVVVAFSSRVASRARADIEDAPVEARWRMLPGPAAERVGEQAAATARMTAGAHIDVDVHCVLGRPVEAIVDIAEEVDADLVVVGN